MPTRFLEHILKREKRKRRREEKQRLYQTQKKAPKLLGFSRRSRSLPHTNNTDSNGAMEEDQRSLLERHHQLSAREEQERQELDELRRLRAQNDANFLQNSGDHAVEHPRPAPLVRILSYDQPLKRPPSPPFRGSLSQASSPLRTPTTIRMTQSQPSPPVIPPPLTKDEQRIVRKIPTPNRLVLDSPTQGGSTQSQQQHAHPEEPPPCSTSLIDSRFLCGMDQACTTPDDVTTEPGEVTSSSPKAATQATAGGGSPADNPLQYYLWDPAAQLFQRSGTANTTTSTAGSRVTFDAASAVTEPFDNRSRTWSGFAMNNYFRWGSGSRSSSTSSPRKNQSTPKSVFQIPVEPVSPVGSTGDWDDQLAQHMEDKLKLTPLVILEEDDTESLEARHGLEDSLKPHSTTSALSGVPTVSPDKSSQPRQIPGNDDSSFLPFLKEPPLTSYMSGSIVEPRRLDSTKTPPQVGTSTEVSVPPPRQTVSRNLVAPESLTSSVQRPTSEDQVSAIATDLPDQKPMARQHTFPQTTKKKFVKPVDDDFWKDLMDEGVIEASDLSRHSSCLDD